MGKIRQTPGTGEHTWACIVRMGGMGDNLIASSVLPGLKQKYDRVEVITRAPNHVVFENNPHIDKLTVWPENERITDPLEWARALGRRGAEYDFFAHLSHTCEVSLAFMESQNQFWWPEKARRQIADHSYLSFVHMLCDVPDDFAPRFYPTGAELLKARETRKIVSDKRSAPQVGWCLAGSRIDKAYPGSHIVISRLLEMGLNVIMFGSPGKEFLMAKEIEKQVQQQTGSSEGLHLCMSNSLEQPNWPVRRSLTQIGLCDVVVSPDTGPAWSVAMLPMPKVILLSHASPKNITHGWVNTNALYADASRVPCWPCHQLHDHWGTCRKTADIDAAACISDISVAAIVKAVVDALNSRAIVVPHETGESPCPTSPSPNSP